MKNWKSILLLVLVFFTGLVVGVVGTRVVVRHMVQRAIADPERLQRYLERNMAWKLRLDADQRVRLHDILTDTHSQMRDLRLQFQPQMALIFSNANVQITGMLTPDQQARFERYKAANFPRLSSPTQPAAQPAP